MLVRRGSRGLRSAATVLRAASAKMDALAARADRGMRSLSARQCALEAHALLSRAAAKAPAREALNAVALSMLAERRGWSRLDGDQFTFAFGNRRAVVALSAQWSPAEIASVITRTEIKVLHGDMGGELVRHLQELAGRELNRLFASWRRP